jgi:hypothetical protein
VEFVRQKISEEARVLSQRNRALELSNINRVRLGPYHLQVFGLQGNDIMDVIFEFEDIHNIFHLSELDIEMVRLQCM